MPRYDVALHIEIEAEDEEAAFAYVRQNYAVVDDPLDEIHHCEDFHVDEPVELEDGESVTA